MPSQMPSQLLRWRVSSTSASAVPEGRGACTQEADPSIPQHPEKKACCGLAQNRGREAERPDSPASLMAVARKSCMLPQMA